MDTMELPSARPYAYRFKAETTALIIIDMQRDFLDFNGFGQIQANNDVIFKKVREIVPKTRLALDTARDLGMHVIHTREGHKPNLSDLPPSKRLRQISSPTGNHKMTIGDEGPMGRLLVRGEYGHDIIDELRPHPGEVVIDKPGKGTFWDTKLHRVLFKRGVTHLLFAGVTTECCVNTTAREASDRGFECCILSDCTDGFNAGFYTKTLDMYCSFDGLFGFVGSSDEFVRYKKPQVVTPPESPSGFEGDLSIPALKKLYANGQLRPTELIRHVTKRIESYKTIDPAAWTSLASPEQLFKDAQALEDKYHGKALPPLYGTVFAVKDSIDVAGVPTTVACEDFAYTPAKHAKAVTDLLNAGALYVGKSNLDQFATGLTGCRSPYGTPRSTFSGQHISGGSSSGSAVVVGAGLVSFALATDTAGSGRVPAAFNGVVGYKPTLGTISTQGLVPACRTLDTISIMAKSVHDTRQVWLAIEDAQRDPDNAFARAPHSLPLWHADFRGPKTGGFTFAVPPQSALAICSPVYQDLYAKAVVRLQRAGGKPVTEIIDWTPFAAANVLLYDATLVHERIAGLGAEYLETNMHKFHPTTQEIYKAALASPAKPWDVFRDIQKRAECIAAAAQVFEGNGGTKEKVDVIIVPTAPLHPTVAEVEQDPIRLNSMMGEFTHFGNVLDLCAVALPADTYQDQNGTTLPFGVTLIGGCGRDGRVFDIAREFERTA